MANPDTHHQHMAKHERRRGPATIDVVMMIVFAVLGFIGAVVLYYLKFPSIITSIFLATGVAALVYGFLGGIQGATFKWGALKLGGSMAALVGVAFGVNYYLTPTLGFRADGQYEWQWAGDGWRGYVTVSPKGTAEIVMKRFMTCGGQLTEKPLLRMNEKGAATANVDGSKLNVTFHVTFVQYDANCNGTDLPYSTVISGELNRTPAFAGRINYVNKYSSSTGDMILVKDYHSVPGEVIVKPPE